MTTPVFSPQEKKLILGTALWGWGIDRASAFALLDNFIISGGRVVDTATNYPINKRTEDYGLALKWISEWLAFSGRPELHVIVKVGSTDNSGSDSVDLTPLFISKAKSYLTEMLGPALYAMSIHWDNRGSEVGDKALIAETIKVFSELSDFGLTVGFSGVKYPQNYLELAPHLAGKWLIQVKENVLSNDARKNYSRVFPNAKYLAYGINMGGIKLAPPSEYSSVSLRGIRRPEELTKVMLDFLESEYGLHPRPTNLNELALIKSYINQGLSGVIIGPRNVIQLKESLNFWRRLEVECSPVNF